MRRPHAGALVWMLATLLALAGLALSPLLAAGGAAVLAARAAWGPLRRGWDAAPRHRPLLGLLAAAVPALLLLAPHVGWVVAGGLAGQAFLALAGWDATRGKGRVPRVVLPALGHATLLVGAFLTYAEGSVGARATIAYASGAAVLALHAYWSQRLALGRDDGWEAALLLAGVVGILGAVAHYAATLGRLPAWVPAPAGLAAASLLLVLAILASPPPAPRWLRGDHTLVEVFSHGVAGTLLLNVVFLAYSLVAAWSVRAILAAILCWSFLGVYMEYRNVTNFRRALQRGDLDLVDVPLPDPPVPVTVLVTAANEANVLPASLARNMAVRYPLRFLLVPALKSTDGTVELCHRLAAEHPDRVRVVEGTTGSKAEDLNLAWRDVDTDVVLLLDADETVDEASLARGLRHLLDDPEAGIVQGRKVSNAPEESFLARFISTERRYSTGMDTVMHAQRLGSTHFGGSAALLRREAPLSVGGWTTRSMTEDIDLTLRMHLQSRWKIRYEPRMLVRESDPRNLRELLRQRTRWSRGWIQCVNAYLPGVVEKRRELGAKRALGLSWMLLTCVAALWTTLFPATVLLRLAGLSLLMPIKVALLVALLMLPARLVSYGYGARHDPVIPIPQRIRRWAEFVLHAYLWILFGWFVSLHSLYLEAFSAPRIWYVTGKKGGGAAPTPPPAAGGPRPANAG